jgi:Histidine kinase/GHKL domain
MIEKVIGNSILLKLLIGKKWSLLRHVCLIIFLGILFYPSIDETMISKVSPLNAKEIVLGIRKASIVTYFVTLIFIYFNLFFLTPKFLMRNKFVVYITGCLIAIFLIFISDVVVSSYFLKMVEEIVPLPTISLKGFVDSSLVPIVFLAACAGFQVFKKWIVDSEQLAELKQTKVEQELTNLKNQINPHFLFNTLNNLNTLITVDAKKASAVVLGLSDVLRYQLYEAVEQKVLLKKDIEILGQFLELEKIRRDNFEFSINVEGDISSILINFVENAIKHSIDNTGFSYISIHFSVSNNVLNFDCQNSKPSIIKAKVNGGLGLQNIKRRLELMYEEKFTLDIKDDKKEFLIKLQLPL